MEPRQGQVLPLSSPSAAFDDLLLPASRRASLPCPLGLLRLCLPLLRPSLPLPLIFLARFLLILPTCGCWGHTQSLVPSGSVRTYPPSLQGKMALESPAQPLPEVHTGSTSPTDIRWAPHTDLPKDVEKSESSPLLVGM